MTGFFDTFLDLWSAPWPEFFLGAFVFAAVLRGIIYLLFYRKKVTV